MTASAKQSGRVMELNDMLKALLDSGEQFIIEPVEGMWYVHSPIDRDGDMFGFCKKGSTLEDAVSSAYQHVIIENNDCSEYIADPFAASK